MPTVTVEPQQFHQRRTRRAYKCVICDREFHAKRGTSKHLCCSRECGFEWQRGDRAARAIVRRATAAAIKAAQPKTVKLHACSECGTPCNGTHNSLCSPECRAKRKQAALRRADDKQRASALAINQSIEKECEWCGSKFSGISHMGKRYFCSSRCGQKATRRKHDGAKRAQFVEPVSIGYLIARDAGRCQLCGRAVRTDCQVPHPLAPTMDHIVPLAGGGDHSKANTQLAHFQCNSVKSNAAGGQLRLIG
jgi:5-methylcytosine-specific restriction endonuclease McrA